jgi:hypothetical protein
VSLRQTARIEAGLIALCLAARTLAVFAAEPATLVRLLESLRAQGANVIYSSDLVDPTFTAPGSPDNGDLCYFTADVSAS